LKGHDTERKDPNIRQKRQDRLEGTSTRTGARSRQTYYYLEPDAPGTRHQAPARMTPTASRSSFQESNHDEHGYIRIKQLYSDEEMPYSQDDRPPSSQDPILRSSPLSMFHGLDVGPADYIIPDSEGDRPQWEERTMSKPLGDREDEAEDTEQAPRSRPLGLQHCEPVLSVGNDTCGRDRCRPYGRWDGCLYIVDGKVDRTSFWDRVDSSRYGG